MTTNPRLPILLAPEPLPRPVLRATVEAAAEYREATLERARLRTLLRDLEAQEPPCECTQTDVDLFDAGACEFHNPSSSWNVALRAVTPAQRYEIYEPAEAQECPF